MAQVSVDDSPRGADRILGSSQLITPCPPILYTCIYTKILSHMKLIKSVVLHWKKPMSVFALLWWVKHQYSSVATTGAGRKRGQLGVFYHQTQRSSCRGWLSECYSGGIKVWGWFPCCLDVYLNWHWKLFTLPASSYFFSTVFSRHEKTFCLGKVRTESKGKGAGRAWVIFPVME